MKAVILVGGKGTRLRPLTFRTPKQLLPLVNRASSLEFLLDLCDEAGIGEVIFSTGYLPEHFQARYPDNRFRSLHLTYAHEDHPLDTAGGIKNCQPHLDDTFVVFNSDVLTGLPLSDMIDFHHKKSAVATIALKAVDDPRRFGLVPIDDDQRVIDFLEKPAFDEDVATNLINAGCYVLEPAVLELVPAAQPYSIERGLFPSLLEYGEPVYGYPFDDYWLDIGTPASYLQANIDLLQGALSWTPPGDEIAPGVFAGEGCVIDVTAKLTGPIVLADAVTIAAGATLEGPLVIASRVTVGEETRLAGSVVHAGAAIGPACDVEGSIVGEDAILRERVVVADGSVVGPGADVEPDNELRRGIRVWPDVVVPQGSIRF